MPTEKHARKTRLKKENPVTPPAATDQNRKSRCIPHFFTHHHRNARQDNPAGNPSETGRKQKRDAKVGKWTATDQKKRPMQ
jgi:hypothetical protein